MEYNKEIRRRLRISENKRKDLFEKTRRLEIENNEIIVNYCRIEEENKVIKKENLELTKNYREILKEYMELKEENERLKEENIFQYWKKRIEENKERKEIIEWENSMKLKYL